MDKKESCVVFMIEDWRTPFIEYLVRGTLPANRKLVSWLKKLASRYFLQNGILFKKGSSGDLLRCLGPRESKDTVKEIHLGEGGSHPRKRRFHKQLLALRYYWPKMKRILRSWSRYAMNVKCWGIP